MKVPSPVECPPDSSLGKKIQYWRRAAGVSQVELASRTGVHQVNISRLENDRAGVTIKTVEAILDGLDLQLTIVPK